MALHWTKAQAHEKDPADKNGLYSDGKGLSDDLKKRALGLCDAFNRVQCARAMTMST